MVELSAVIGPAAVREVSLRALLLLLLRPMASSPSDGVVLLRDNLLVMLTSSPAPCASWPAPCACSYGVTGVSVSSEKEHVGSTLAGGDGGGDGAAAPESMPERAPSSASASCTRAISARPACTSVCTAASCSRWLRT